MEKNSETEIADFSLAKAIPFQGFFKRLGFMNSSPKPYRNRVLVMAMVTWLPLLLLATLQGVAFGNKVELTFLKDFALHIRFLVLIPLFLVSEKIVDARLKELTNQFFKAGILANRDLPQYDVIKNRIRALSESIVPDLVILLIVVVNAIIKWKLKSNEVTYWEVIPGDTGTISWAGIWLGALSLPLFQYLMLDWIWRWILWFLYFIKIAKLPLKLNPAHPDQCGGLGFLGMPPAPFLSVNFALAILFASAIAERVFFLHQKLPEYYPLIGGFAVFSILFNVLPLLVFMKPLVKLRKRGLLEYSALIQEHHRKFDEKWLTKTNEESLLGNPDASSMADINSNYVTVMSMQIVPFNLKIMFSSIIITVLPLLPLFAFEYNLIDLIKKLAGMLV